MPMTSQGSLIAKTSAITAAAISTVLSLVMSFEGERLESYQDVVGVWTICYGHTGSEVVKGLKVDKEQCEAWLIEDMTKASKAVDDCIRVPLTPGQRGAFISAAFNVGPRVVCGSTLQRKANAGDLEGACRELTHAKGKDGKETGWTFAGGVRYKGLVKRREKEREICWPTKPKPAPITPPATSKTAAGVATKKGA